MFNVAVTAAGALSFLTLDRRQLSVPAEPKRGSQDKPRHRRRRRKTIVDQRVAPASKNSDVWREEWRRERNAAIDRWA